jgi:biopolymer transport protein ExbB
MKPVAQRSAPFPAVLRHLLPLAIIALPGQALAQTVDPYGLDSVWNGGPVARVTLAILLLMSVASWTVVLVKLIDVLILERQARGAERALRDHPVTSGAVPSGSPFYPLIGAATEANTSYAPELAVDRHTWIGLNLQQPLNRLLERAQSGLAIPAMVGSTAPFVGLFGTVWGIHHALTEIGVSGQASIDKVAGPVGEALIMTALGLVVAVPAVFGHAILARRGKAAGDAVRGFSSRLMTRLIGGSLPGERSEPVRPRLSVRGA